MIKKYKRKKEKERAIKLNDYFDNVTYNLNIHPLDILI